MLRKRSIAEIEPFDPEESKDNWFDFGVLYTTTGKTTEKIFITAKRSTGEEICIAFTIEDAFEIIEAIRHCTQVAILDTKAKES